MDREQLFRMADYILNEATSQEIEVIKEAVKRRESRSRTKGFGGFSPENAARDMAGQINRQVALSKEQVRDMVQGFVVEIIKKNAPELTEAQIKELTDTWLAEKGGRTGSGQRGRRSPAGGVSGKSTSQDRAGGPKGGQRRELPRDVLLTMVRQFLAYSTGAMSMTEQNKLHQEIPDWPNEYWDRFPDEVKELAALFLKGMIDEETLWDRLSLC